MEAMRNPGEVIQAVEKDLLESWIEAQTSSSEFRDDLISVQDLRVESGTFLREFSKALASDNVEDIARPEYRATLELLQRISRSRAAAGFTPMETATFVFSLKDSILEHLQAEYGSDPERLNTVVVQFSKLLDKLGLKTIEEYARGREQVIREQADAMLELSSPIVTLWDRVLAVPIVGTLDSRRTQLIMEGLLQRIVDTSSRVAIIDITGVAVMDTLVATHLIKTVNAVKLLGAEAVITGIRPEIAQTVIHLGVDLSEVSTRATMAEGLAYALKAVGMRITPA